MAELDEKDEELENKESGWSWWPFNQVAISQNSENLWRCYFPNCSLIGGAIQKLNERFASNLLYLEHFLREEITAIF